MPKDPICGMQVDKKTPYSAQKKGKTYYFCSKECKDRFFEEEESPQEHSENQHSHAGGHGQHHEHMLADFKKRFWISLAATVPVLLLSPFIQSLMNFHFRFPGDGYVLFIFASSIFFYGGWPFLKGLAEELKKRQPGMMTLISLAISVAYIYSSLVVFGLEGKLFFWELATLVDIMLLGHWIEMRSVMGASRALEEIAQLLPSKAHRIKKDGSTEDIELDKLGSGDKILIKPGEKIPADGVVIEGKSEVNESLITGESRPVKKKKDSNVIGGAVNSTGSLTVKITKTGKDSYLNQMLDLVKRASESKSRAQNFADRAAFWLTIIAITTGLATITVWLILGKEFVFSLERMVTVMVITCPHALGLAVPLVIAVITGISAKNGLLIRQRTPFENARLIDTVVFDKTGTLTRGEFEVTDIVPLSGSDEKTVLQKAASVETNSEHTIAAGIVKKAEEMNLGIPQSSDFNSLPGRGAGARVDNETVYIGNKELLKTVGTESEELLNEMDKLSSQGKTAVAVVAGEKPLGVIALADPIRYESKEAIESLKKAGVEVSMITGDNETTARYVAGELGLNDFFADVLPDKKSEKIKQLQDQNKKVAMVGDGVNDAPALAQADAGIAIGTGTDVAVETADIVLVKNDPRDVVNVLALSKITNRKMKQNLAWATGYNVVAIPLAAGVLYNQGIILAPAVGALVMSVSTIIVAINARATRYHKSDNSNLYKE